jgi:hypothetical protein
MPEFSNIDLDHYLQFYDGHPEGAYGHIFKLFTDNPLRYRSDLDDQCDECLTMFEDVIVGQSKNLNWYQYGFTEPQVCDNIPIPIHDSNSVL